MYLSISFSCPSKTMFCRYSFTYNVAGMKYLGSVFNESYLLICFNVIITSHFCLKCLLLSDEINCFQPHILIIISTQLSKIWAAEMTAHEGDFEKKQNRILKSDYWIAGYIGHLKCMKFEKTLIDIFSWKEFKPFIYLEGLTLFHR